MSDMAVDYERRPITVEEYHWLDEQGFFEDDDVRVELLDGELIRLPPIGPHHNYATNAAIRKLVLTFAERAVVSAGGSVILDDYSEPLPDLMVLEGSIESYKEHVPRPDDVALVVEVSESSLGKDRVKKARAYARAGIREYWVVNLIDSCVEVMSKPEDGAYASRRIVRRGESIAPQAFPADSFAVDDFLP